MDDNPSPLLAEDAAAEQDRSYEELAYEAIQELVDREHAVVWHEVEARLADHPLPGQAHPINPHHLSNARRQLIDDDVIEEVTGTTKGGREITVLGFRNRYRRETAFDRAARRKRLLETRYLSWAGGGAETNAIGTGGELVSHASLAEAAAKGIGYRLLSEGREVRQLLGAPIPGGPIDDAAMLIGSDLTDPTHRWCGTPRPAREVPLHRATQWECYRRAMGDHGTSPRASLPHSARSQCHQYATRGSCRCAVSRREPPIPSPSAVARADGTTPTLLDLPMPTQQVSDIARVMFLAF